MDPLQSPMLPRCFRYVLRVRVAVVALYALLVPLGLWGALRIGNDSAIDSLVVRSDPDYLATQEFQKLFPEGGHVLLLVEAEDIFSPVTLDAVDLLGAALQRIPKVTVFSALSLFRRQRPDFSPRVHPASDFAGFARGTRLLARQGLVGDNFLGMALGLDVRDATERDHALAEIQRVVRAVDLSASRIRVIRKVGAPFVDSYLENEMDRASLRFFPLLAVFVILLNLALYRSVRALLAFLGTLAAATILTVGCGHLLGYSFTIVSSVVPLTVLITCTAALVYLHSRFVDHPPGVPVHEHQIAALCNKFLATTTSLFAAAVGFGALVVSHIRPIREMGIWVALGMLISWLAVFTLFPALQRLLRTPTQQTRRIAGPWFDQVAEALPWFSYRWRWVLVPGALLVALSGLVALLGWPGAVRPMPLEVDGLAYINRDLDLYKDTRQFEQQVSGLTRSEIWVSTPAGAALSTATLRSLDAFGSLIEEDERVGAVVSLATLLRLRQYVAGHGDQLPPEEESLAALAGDLEQLLLEEPAMQAFVDAGSLSHLRITVTSRGGDWPTLQAFLDSVRDKWRQAQAEHPALEGTEIRIVGQGLLQSKISHYLVPTLAQSFALTAVIIFVAFALVFRSLAAMALAIIPSLFGILAMFVVMRLGNIPLNVATILIASTVLGASENDQIHFFFHFQEGRRNGSTEQALRHTLRIAGRAILFATLINAGGFLALALSDLPPMKQFGILAASAFVLAMVADFTALLAALWLVFRQRPDELRKATADRAAGRSAGPGSA